MLWQMGSTYKHQSSSSSKHFHWDISSSSFYVWLLPAPGGGQAGPRPSYPPRRQWSWPWLPPREVPCPGHIALTSHLAPPRTADINGQLYKNADIPRRNGNHHPAVPLISWSLCRISVDYYFRHNRAIGILVVCFCPFELVIICWSKELLFADYTGKFSLDWDVNQPELQPCKMWGTGNYEQLSCTGAQVVHRECKIKIKKIQVSTYELLNTGA